MAFTLKAASDQHLAFARSLTHQAMGHYYRQYDLTWSDKGFDTAWAGRENWLICRDAAVLGFTSLSRDANALYIRELHVSEAARGQGIGSWTIDQVFALACQERRPALRLTVFTDNPAQALYLRMGLQIVGQDDCFLRMQRPCPR